MFVYFRIIMHLVLLLLTCSPHLSQYMLSLSRHSCSPLADVENSSKSSAHDNELIFRSSSFTGSQSCLNISCRSFWNMLANVGLRLQPCFTPIFDTKLSVSLLPALTEYSLCEYIDLINWYGRIWSTGLSCVSCVPLTGHHEPVEHVHTRTGITTVFCAPVQNVTSVYTYNGVRLFIHEKCPCVSTVLINVTGFCMNSWTVWATPVLAQCSVHASRWIMGYIFCARISGQCNRM